MVKYQKGGGIHTTYEKDNWLIVCVISNILPSQIFKGEKEILSLINISILITRKVFFIWYQNISLGFSKSGLSLELKIGKKF
jgi:hypothetical protein